MQCKVQCGEKQESTKEMMLLLQDSGRVQLIPFWKTNHQRSLDRHLLLIDIMANMLQLKLCVLTCKQSSKVIPWNGPGVDVYLL